MMMLTKRERFITLLANQPLRRGDVAVILAGEDGLARTEVAFELFRQRAATCFYVTGQLDDGEHLVGAPTIGPKLIARGVAHDRIVLDVSAMNTADQARNVADVAEQRGWHVLLLAASAYHMPRAFLTMLRALQRKGNDATTLVVPIAAAQTRWGEPPPGATLTRLQLLTVEFDKIERYGDDVASFDDGLDYLLHWEMKATPALVRE